MKKWLTVLSLSLLFIVCEEQKSITPKHQPKHKVEEIVFNFIKNVKQDVYAEDIYFFVADTELTKADREHYFRRLEKYIRNNDWNLYFTAIDIYNSQEDMADVILKARSGDLLVFCLDYWYDTERWELDGYEFPPLTFNRPRDQSYDDYVQQIIKQTKDAGADYSERETIQELGTYYIEYK